MQQQQQQHQLAMRAGASSYGVQSPPLQQQQQQPATAPHQYACDTVVADSDGRWMLHGAAGLGYHPSARLGNPAGFIPAAAARDYAGGYGHAGGGGLVGNATPTLARRATVEYRAQPGLAAYPAMDYPPAPPPLSFAPLPFQAAAAGYAKHNY